MRDSSQSEQHTANHRYRPEQGVHLFASVQRSATNDRALVRPKDARLFSIRKG
jgi:hypothetical protein